MAHKCPLCYSTKTNTIATFAVSDLNKVYVDKFKINTESEFKGEKEISLLKCLDCDLRFYNPQTPGGESFYKQLQKFPWYYLEEKDEYKFAKKFINNSDLVLDVGSGNGAFSEIVKPATFTGLEFNNAAIEEGKKKGINIINETVEEHANKNFEKYDIVSAFQVLEHVTTIHDFIKSCLKCLKPNGLLIFSVPSNDSFIRNVNNLVMNMPPHHMSRWSDESLKNIGKVFNLEVVQIDHENLSKLHHFLYSTTQWEELLRKGFGKKTNEIVFDTSIKNFVFNKFAKLLGLVFPIGIKKNKPPYGHSVTIVLKKKG